MESDFGELGQRAPQYVFDAGLGGGHGEGVAIAAEASGDPEDIDFGNAFRGWRTCHISFLFRHYHFDAWVSRNS